MDSETSNSLVPLTHSLYFLIYSFYIIIYIILFAFLLWLFISLYCYIVEIIVWFLLERHVRSRPGNLIDIMIPDQDFREKMKVMVSGLFLRMKGVNQEGKCVQEEMKYVTGEMVSSHSTECAICLDDFVDGETCRVLIVCNHIYHSSCIDQWLKFQLNCPICRKPVVDS